MLVIAAAALVLSMPQVPPAVQQAPAHRQRLHAVAAELGAIGVKVDPDQVEVVEADVAGVAQALRRSVEPVVGPSHIEALWFAMGAAALDVEKEVEDFANNYFRTLGLGQPVWYATATRQLLVSTSQPATDLDREFARELARAARHQQSDPIQHGTRLGTSTDALLLARSLAEGEADLARALVTLHRQRRDPAKLTDEELAITAAERTDFSVQFGRAFGRAHLGRAFRSGGWPAVGRALATPPANSARYLHPERDQWASDIVLSMPEWPTALGKAAIVRDDTFGELGLRLFVGSAGGDKVTPELAAIGWRADAMRLWRREDGSRAMVWRLCFDRPTDAEFFRACVGRARGRIEIRGTVVDWAYAAEDTVAAELQKALAAIPLPAAPTAGEAEAAARAERPLLDAMDRIEDGRWHVPSIGFSVPVEPGFVTEMVGNSPVLYAPPANDPQNASFRDYVLVSTEPAPAPIVETLMAIVKESLTRAPYSLVKTEKRRLDGRDVLWTEFTSQNQRLHHIQVDWLQDGKVISLSTTSLDSRWPAAAPVFTKLLEGLAFRR